MNTLNIIIPTLNRKDLLIELLHSLDKQKEFFNKLLIIDNGSQNLHTDLNNFNFENKLIIYTPGYNLGVAKSWNHGINLFKNEATHLLILNDDIVLEDNQLQTIHSHLDSTWLKIGPYFWSVFLLFKDCWGHFMSNDGYVFDENFYPAYFEDNDFYYRVHLYNNSIQQNLKYLEPSIKRNSMTIKKDSSINNRFGTNEGYYIKKWGGMPGREKFKKPFNT